MASPRFQANRKIQLVARCEELTTPTRICKPPLSHPLLWHWLACLRYWAASGVLQEHCQILLPGAPSYNTEGFHYDKPHIRVKDQPSKSWSQFYIPVVTCCLKEFAMSSGLCFALRNFTARSICKSSGSTVVPNLGIGSTFPFISILQKITNKHSLLRLTMIKRKTLVFVGMAEQKCVNLRCTRNPGYIYWTEWSAASKGKNPSGVTFRVLPSGRQGFKFGWLPISDA